MKQRYVYALFFFGVLSALKGATGVEAPAAPKSHRNEDENGAVPSSRVRFPVVSDGKKDKDYLISIDEVGDVRTFSPLTAADFEKGVGKTFIFSGVAIGLDTKSGGWMEVDAQDGTRRSIMLGWNVPHSGRVLMRELVRVEKEQGSAQIVVMGELGKVGHISKGDSSSRPTTTYRLKDLRILSLTLRTPTLSWTLSATKKE